MTVTAARIASAPGAVQCPPWCVVDHAEDAHLLRFPGDRDVVHRSAFTFLRPDGALSDGGPWELAAQLAAPELGYAPTTLVVDLGESLGSYVELTAETADQFIRDLKTFTARVQQLRDEMATANKEQQS